MDELYYTDITVYGFHGCQRTIADKLLSGEKIFRVSENKFDWLGHGIYFWENDWPRANVWATERFGKEGCVLGARINLESCFDLSNSYARSFLREAYESLAFVATQTGSLLPENRRGSRDLGNPDDRKLRYLDCAVINYAFDLVRETYPDLAFDSVRGAFQEGYELFPGSSIRESDHIQLCIRNPACIQSLFEPEF